VFSITLRLLYPGGSSSRHSLDLMLCLNVSTEKSLSLSAIKLRPSCLLSVELLIKIHYFSECFQKNFCIRCAIIQSSVSVSNLLINLCSRAIFEKLIVAQLVKNLPAFCRIRRFITVFAVGHILSTSPTKLSVSSSF